MTKEEFEKYKLKPYNIDMQQMFYTHVEELVNSNKVREADKYYMRAWLKESSSRMLQAACTSVVECIFKRET